MRNTHKILDTFFLRKINPFAVLSCTKFKPCEWLVRGREGDCKQWERIRKSCQQVPNWQTGEVDHSSDSWRKIEEQEKKEKQDKQKEVFAVVKVESKESEYSVKISSYKMHFLCPPEIFLVQLCIF